MPTNRGVAYLKPGTVEVRTIDYPKLRMPKSESDPFGGKDAPHGVILKVVTTNMREGYLRKNGVPYSESAVITEYVDRLGPEPDRAVYLLIRTMVEDPKYLQQPFVTSTHFRLEAEGSKWNPTPCKTDPPAPLK